MLAAATVIFRETLEIALILTVVLAATRGLPHRNRWVFIGIAAGILGSTVIALFAESISNIAEGTGQEIFNASVLLLAAGMIGWTVIWMRTHAREITTRIKKMGQAAAIGEAPLYSMAVVIALAMFREGSEMVLFSYGLLASGMSFVSYLTGTLLGFLGGAIIGVLFYYGMLKFLAKHFFAVTSWLLVFLAAGMASQGIGFLSNAGYVPEMGYPVWDSSALLSENSALGSTLKVLIGYTAQPSGVQLLIYALTVAVIVVSMRTFGHSQPPKQAQTT